MSSIVSRVLSLIAILILLSVPPAFEARADSSDTPVKGGWNQTGVTVSVWRYDANAGVWVDAPGGIAEDPNIYRFEYLCLIDNNNNFDVPCLAAAVRCDQARDGRPVRWYTSLRVFDPPIWSAVRPDRCVYLEEPVDVLGQIAAQIQTKFQQLPINAGNSVTQPSPHTLRGAETNLYAEAAEQTFSVDMLGQDVVIIAKPVQYTWSYGDGTSLGPQTAAGGPLPQDHWGEKTLTSHIYAQTGDFAVVLTTHFQGTYSVNGGPALPIPGQGQFSSAPQTVSVWRSITRNYADTCLQNPEGQGCPGVAPPPP